MKVSMPLGGGVVVGEVDSPISFFWKVKVGGDIR